MADPVLPQYPLLSRRQISGIAIDALHAHPRSWPKVVRRELLRAQRIAEIDRELAELRRSVERGRAAKSGRPAKRRRRAKAKARAQAKADGVPRDARGHRITAKARAAHAIQGRYLVALAVLKREGRKRDFARVKATAKKDGVAAAVKVAARLLG